MLVLLFRTQLFGYLFSMLYLSWNVNVACFIERQTDDYRTAQWNSLGSCFHLEIDVVFYSCIEHGVRYNSLLENA